MITDPKNRDLGNRPADLRDNSDLNEATKISGTAISPKEDRPEPAGQTQYERASNLAEDAINELSDQRFNGAEKKDRSAS